MNDRGLNCKSLCAGQHCHSKSLHFRSHLFFVFLYKHVHTIFLKKQTKNCYTVLCFFVLFFFFCKNVFKVYINYTPLYTFELCNSLCPCIYFLVNIVTISIVNLNHSLPAQLACLVTVHREGQ